MSERPRPLTPSPEVKPYISGEARSPISIDVLVFALLCAAYLPMRFIVPAPWIVPGSVTATITLVAAAVGYFALA